jgi:kynurenine 3-monooxygenase
MRIINLFLFLDFVVKAFSIPIKTTKVLIVGGGPAGLLTAHCLLSREHDYEIKLIESREPPEEEGVGIRAYSLGLNIRGQTALQYFDTPQRSKGLWSAVKSTGVLTDSFYLHFGDRAFQLRKPNKKTDTSSPPPTLLLPRNKLCEAMSRNLLETYRQKKLSIQYNCPLQRVDINSKLAYIGPNSDPYAYDLIIGADGVQSPLRRSMYGEYKKEKYVCEEEILPGEFKVMVQPLDGSTLDPDAVHLLPQGKAGFGLFVIPGINNTSCTLVNWQTDAKIFASDSSVAEVQEAIEESFPKYGAVSSEAANQLLQQRPSVAQTVRCNTYSDDRGVLLLGDAAHSTGAIMH